MNEFLDKLLSLRRLSTSGEGVEFRLAHELPAWGWALIVSAIVLYAAWSYSRLLGTRWSRIALACLRALALLLLAVLVAGPELVKQNERVERDWVVVMADRSASMTVADAPPKDATSTRATREDQLTRTIRSSWPTFAGLSRDRNLMMLGFDAEAYPLRTIDGGRPGEPPSGVDLGTPGGQRTLIGQSLEQALRRTAARPVSGIVLISDGRSADAPSRALMRELEARQVPIFVVPLGSATPLPDIALTRIEAPTAAFIGDFVPVNVRIERLGEGSGPGGRVQLINTTTGELLDEREIPSRSSTPGNDQQPEQVTLTAKPGEAGVMDWTVKLVLDAPDLSPENNRANVRIELVDRPIRVAYFDGYPRWEYRYLKNLIVREKSIRSTTMLMASDKRYIQEGTDPLETLPRSKEQWNTFDVIVMGDLRPSLFSDEQLASIRSLVSERGAGLLWIGGQSATPTAWKGTPLADLLPFTLSGADSAMPSWSSPVLLMPGDASRTYGVLNLANDAEKPWPDTLADWKLGWPLLRWAQRIDPSTLKPTAEVLGMAVPASGDEPARPLVLTMRYGAGRIAYVGSDETWRYRYGRGETLPERFWLPLVRLLARESLGRLGKPASLTASPERAQTGQQIQVSVRLLDQTLMDRKPGSISLRATRVGDARSERAIVLRPDGQVGDETSGVFVGTLPAGEPGVYEITPNDALLAGLDLSARVEVVLPEDELRVPQSDHDALARLAQASGGAVVQPDELATIANLLPNRQVRLLGSPDVETLWDKPAIWALLMLLLTLEWAGRRLIKLS